MFGGWQWRRGRLGRRSPLVVHCARQRRGRCRFLVDSKYCLLTMEKALFQIPSSLNKFIYVLLQAGFDSIIV